MNVNNVLQDINFINFILLIMHKLIDVVKKVHFSNTQILHVKMKLKLKKLINIV